MAAALLAEDPGDDPVVLVPWENPEEEEKAKAWGQNLYNTLSPGNAKKDTLVDLLEEAPQPGRPTRTRWFNFQQTNSNLYSLAHAAVIGGNLELFQTLLEHGDDDLNLSLIDTHGRTAAMIAAYQGKDEIMRELCRFVVSQGRERDMLIIGQRDNCAGNAAETDHHETILALAEELPPRIARAVLGGEGFGEKEDPVPLQKARNRGHTKTAEMIEQQLRDLPYVLGVLNMAV
jgi:ankyrin repeat protein